MAARGDRDQSRSNRNGLERLDRAVVVVATACAGVGIPVEIARFIASSDPEWLLRAATPATIALVGGVQLYRRRPRVDVVLAMRSPAWWRSA